MKTLMTCAAVLVAFAAPAGAETRYDRKIEQAVMDIVARKMGELRGGLSYDEKPRLVVVQDTMTTGSIGIETGRLAAGADRPREPPRAVERRISRVIIF